MKRVFTILVIVILGGWLLLLGAWYFLRPQLTDLLVQHLQRELKTTFGEYYHLQFHSLSPEIKAFTLSIKLYKPEFTTDTTQLEELGKYPPIYFKADSFEVNGINIRKLLMGSTINLKDIQLHNPALVVLLKKYAKEDKESDPQKKKKPKKIIDNIELSKFTILRGYVNLIQFEDLSDTVYHGNDINLEVTDLIVPTQDPEGVYQGSSLGNLKFSMKDVSFSPERLHYEYRMKSIHIDLNADIFECIDMDLLPEKSLRRMSRDEEYQKTFAQIRLGRLSLSGFDHQKLTNKALHLRSVSIDNAYISLFRDKAKEFDKSKVKQTFQSSLREMALALKVDTVHIHNMTLMVQLLFPNHTTPASIPITNIHGTLTKIKTLPGSQESIKLALKAHIMKTGTLSFDADFPVRLETHQYRVHVNPMPFNEWNGVLTNIANIRIESGMIDNIKLSGNCSNDETKGNIEFRYNNLKCEVLKKTNDGQLKRAGFLSVGSNMLIRHNNPKNPGEMPIRRPVYFKRFYYQGQVALWVGGLLDGMLATILNEAIKERIDQIQAQKHRETIPLPNR